MFGIDGDKITLTAKDLDDLINEVKVIIDPIEIKKFITNLNIAIENLVIITENLKRRLK